MNTNVDVQQLKGSFSNIFLQRKGSRNKENKRTSDLQFII